MPGFSTIFLFALVAFMDADRIRNTFFITGTFCGAVVIFKFIRFADRSLFNDRLFTAAVTGILKIIKAGIFAGAAVFLAIFARKAIEQSFVGAGLFFGHTCVAGAQLAAVLLRSAGTLRSCSQRVPIRAFFYVLIDAFVAVGVEKLVGRIGNAFLIFRASAPAVGVGVKALDIFADVFLDAFVTADFIAVKFEGRLAGEVRRLARSTTITGGVETLGIFAFWFLFTDMAFVLGRDAVLVLFAGVRNGAISIHRAPVGARRIASGAH